MVDEAERQTWLDPGGPEPALIEEWLEKLKPIVDRSDTIERLFSSYERELYRSVRKRYFALRDLGMAQPLTRGQTTQLHRMYEKLAARVAKEMMIAPVRESK